MAKSFRKFAWKKDKKGTIGIGTLIVFIALVLVAAIASAVILKTAYSLKDSAEKTGKAATNEVSGGLKIMDIVGDRQNVANNFIATVTFTCSVWDGSDGVNIEWLRVHWVGPTQSTFVTLNTGTPQTASGTDFSADEIPRTWLVSSDGWDNVNTFWLLNNNMVWITIDLTGAGIGDQLSPGDTAAIYFEPASGLVVEESFTVPASLGTSVFVDLTME